MKTIAFCCALFTTAFLFSCKKETSLEDNVPQNITTATGDSIYLDKVYNIDAVTNDTASIFSYSYDANKRVIIRSYQERLPFGTFAEKEMYSYNGADTLPFKVVNTTNSLDTLISFYTYNSLTQRIKDSVIRVSHTMPGVYNSGTYGYTYTANKIYGISPASGIPVPGIPLSYDTATTDASGNVLSSISYQGTTVTNTATFTYDNKLNPFTRLSNYRTLRIFPYGETFIEEMQAKNNRLHIVESSGYDEDLTGKYTYKTNGYPSQVIIPNAPGHDEKILFRYRTF